MTPETTVPVRTTDHWERRTEDGETRVTIHRPQEPRNRLDGALMRLFGGPTDRELDLDAVGSLVWLHCDGETTVAGIEKRLAEEFPEDRIAPVEETLAYFLAQLAELGVLRYRESRSKVGSDGASDDGVNWESSKFN